MTFTREDAARLIDKSEDEVIDSSKPWARGHSHAHVGSSETSAIDLLSRRKLTTMYRSRTQAEKDLRDALNAHSLQLASLPKGASLMMTAIVSEPRNVYEVEPVGAEYSYAGEKVTTTSKRRLFVKIVRDSAGELSPADYVSQRLKATRAPLLD